MKRLRPTMGGLTIETGDVDVDESFDADASVFMRGEVKVDAKGFSMMPRSARSDSKMDDDDDGGKDSKMGDGEGKCGEEKYEGKFGDDNGSDGGLFRGPLVYEVGRQAGASR